MTDSNSRAFAHEIPEAVAQIGGIMASFPAPWALCGGWAVDAWLGRLTRGHDDVDIAVFVQDQGALHAHLTGWQLIAHEDSKANPGADLWDGRSLVLPAHIHGRSPAESGPLPGRFDPAGARVLFPEDGFSLDIQLGDRDADEWVLSAAPRISLPLGQGIRESPWGLPTAVPEVLLFFKATAYFGIEGQMMGGRYQDEPDFLALAPHLTEDQRYWLRKSIEYLHPSHPWLAHCGSDAQSP